MNKLTSFVSGAQVWQEITKRVRQAKRVHAAVAYVGEAGSRLLPLRRGDQLVVDLSLPSVRAGVTNPFVIERFMRKGVIVASRPGLHAKIVVADGTAIVGSANVSARSATTLDEAAVVTNDAGVVRSALGFVSSASVTPVLPEYLKLCKREYRPPRSHALPRRGERLRPRLWFLNLNGDLDVPDHEREQYEGSERKAQKRRRRSAKASEMDSFWWTERPAFAADIRPGDWVIEVLCYKNGTIQVMAPAQFLWLDRYSRGKGKHRYVFHVERPRRGQSASWSAFRKAIPAAYRSHYVKPRQRRISNSGETASLLSLWTLAGRFKSTR